MTREERENAIKVIKNYDLNFHKINGLLFKAEEIANAFDCALEALEQEPQTDNRDENELNRVKTELEPCDDAISRQAALDIDFNRICVTCAKPGEMIRRKITELPSVNPQEPKTGHWKRVTDKTGHLVWECDCGWQQRFATNYCPDCGSKNE